jgi:hypothetical protein
MELNQYIFKPTTIHRRYSTSKLLDICWQYESGDLSYRQAVHSVKLHCSLNIGLAEQTLFNQLSKRGNRLPMVSTRKIKEVVFKPERAQSTTEQVLSLFRDAKHLRSK